MIDAIYIDVHMVADRSSVYYFLNTDTICTSGSNITNSTMVNGTLVYMLLDIIRLMECMLTAR